MINAGFKCDVCGIPKLETNHWWGVYFDPQRNQFTILPWAEWGDEREMTHHLCGQGCILKLVERYLERQLT